MKGYKFKGSNMSILEHVNIAHSKVKDGNMSDVWGDKEEAMNNKTSFLESNDFDPDHTYEMRSSNEKRDNVVTVNDTPKEFTYIPKCDALITNNPEVVLSLNTADCLQTTIYDPKKRVLALLHCGRQWIDSGIIYRTVEIMKKEFECDPGDFLVHLGSTIAACHYDWDKNIFKVSDPKSWITKTVRKSNDPQQKEYLVDIRAATIGNLLELGVQGSNIVDSKADTYADEQYFSHNRSLDTNTPEARHLTVVQMK